MDYSKLTRGVVARPAQPSTHRVASASQRIYRSIY